MHLWSDHKIGCAQSNYKKMIIYQEKIIKKSIHCFTRGYLTGTLKTLQCVEQKTVFDHVIFERYNVSASVAKTATSSYHNSTNRTFTYAEWKAGIYQANVTVSW